MVDEIEKSPDRGEPVTLYFVQIGPVEKSDFLAFTDSDDVVFHTIAGVAHRFEPVPCSRSDFEDSGDAEKADLKLTTSETNPMVPLFTHAPPSDVVFLTVLEGHAEDPTRRFRAIWTGRVAAMAWTPTGVEFTAQSGAVSVRRPASRRNWQRQCPHALYGPECRAARAPVTFPVVSSGETSLVLDSSTTPLPTGPTAYVAGVVTFTNPETQRVERRTILSVDATEPGVLVLAAAGPVPTGVAEATVEKGCRRTEESCILWHDNIQNFGGQVFIPLDNPVGSLSTFF